VLYQDSLAEIIERSQRLLRPASTTAIIGHGDAHNGNIFVDNEFSELKMFDPAFAGKHDPLLDLTKPLFHNVFARWMYFPEQVAKEIELEFSIKGKEIEIIHNFMPSSLRLAHLNSRVQKVLHPTLDLLKQKASLREDWIAYLRSSLFCCPFLTVNLFAEYKPNGTLAERYPLSIKLLGLLIAISFGSLTYERENELSILIDSIFQSKPQ
jgi:hypothetical protein